MLSQFEIVDKLGEGSYSSVYKVRRKVNKTIYAMKKVKNYNKKIEKERENALNEVRIIASVKHPNIIAYKECFFDSDQKVLCVIMEHADGGDLLQKVRQHRENKNFIQEKQIWNIFIQILQALKALHENNIVHRDLKSANILLCTDGRVKLADFNVSKIVINDMTKTQIGTPFYASPEIWNNKSYDYQADLWSLGCILYEMCCLKTPFQGQDMQQICRRVCRGHYQKIPNIYSPYMTHIIRLMLQLNPEARPSCEKLLLEQFIVDHIRHSTDKLLLFQSNSNNNFDLLSTLQWITNYSKFPIDQEQTIIKKNNNVDSKKLTKKRGLVLDSRDETFSVRLPPSHYTPVSSQSQKRRGCEFIALSFEGKHRPQLLSLQPEHTNQSKPKSQRKILSKKIKHVSQLPISRSVDDQNHQNNNSIEHSYQAPYNHYIEDTLIQGDTDEEVPHNVKTGQSKLKLQLRPLYSMPYQISSRKIQVRTESSQSKRVNTYSVQNSLDTPQTKMEKIHQFNDCSIDITEQNIISRNSISDLNDQFIKQDQFYQPRKYQSILPRRLYRHSVNEQVIDPTSRTQKQKVYSSFDRQKDNSTHTEHQMIVEEDSDYKEEKKPKIKNPNQIKQIIDLLQGNPLRPNLNVKLTQITGKKFSLKHIIN